MYIAKIYNKPLKRYDYDNNGDIIWTTEPPMSDKVSICLAYLSTLVEKMTRMYIVACGMSWRHFSHVNANKQEWKCLGPDSRYGAYVFFLLLQNVLFYLYDPWMIMYFGFCIYALAYMLFKGITSL